MQTNYFSGSTWSKWDLHVHTPYTFMNNSFKCSKEDFINKLKEEKIKVIGLTNYFKFRDEEFELIKELKEHGITALLNLEIRLDYQNKDDSLDLHVIFDSSLKKDEINKLLTNLNVNVKGEEKKCIDLEKEDFKFAVINFDHLLKKLNDESLGIKNRFLIGFLSRGKGNARSSSNYEKIAKNTDFLIHSSDKKSNIEKDVKFWLEKNKPLIQSSDAHKLDDIGSKFTWIKAKPTFEGLKQIIYEPKYRLKISENKPSNPIHFIKSVTLKFEDGIKFNNNTFCFSGTKKTIYFSPNLTCIIGGRGSGKSTILNLIAKKLNILENKDFFSDLEGINEQKLLNSIEVELDGLNNVEYLAQNTIEQFATNTLAFSGAIFERLNKLSNDNLKKLEDEISNDLKLFDKQIKQLKIRYDKHKKLKKLKESLKNYENIVHTFNDEKYTSKKDELQKLQKQYTELSNSIKRLHSFLEVVYEVSTQEPFYILESPIYTSRNDYECNVLKEEELNIVKEPKNEFDKLYNITLKKVQKIYQEIFESEEYKKGSQRLQELKKQYGILKKEIHNYLKEKGIKEDSIQDIQTANENIEKLKLEIKKLKKEILSIKKDINAFSHKKIDENIKKFKDEIQEQLKKSNKILENIANKNEDVKKIEIKFNLYDGIFDIVFKEFEKELDLYEEIRSYREIFKTYLKEIGINEILNLNINNELISLIEQKHKDTKTFGKIKTVFENNTSFLILKTLIEKHQRNIKNNKRFIIYYDNRNIKNSSFGQKCTAVIIIMLLLGNNPIIIDEPEAHLDSSLIANYLVDLIKEVKQDRQIIFATHNANFVLNGDAELIIKLENDNTTTFKSFVIEDIEYREDLLKLEGGKDAFKMRESKYGI